MMITVITVIRHDWLAHVDWPPINNACLIWPISSPPPFRSPSNVPQRPANIVYIYKVNNMFNPLLVDLCFRSYHHMSSSLMIDMILLLLGNKVTTDLVYVLCLEPCQSVMLQKILYPVKKQINDSKRINSIMPFIYIGSDLFIVWVHIFLLSYQQ